MCLQAGKVIYSEQIISTLFRIKIFFDNHCWLSQQLSAEPEPISAPPLLYIDIPSRLSSATRYQEVQHLLKPHYDFTLSWAQIHLQDCRLCRRSHGTWARYRGRTNINLSKSTGMLSVVRVGYMNSTKNTTVKLLRRRSAYLYSAQICMGV